MKVLFLTNIPSPYRVAFFTELGKLCNLTVLYERAQANDRNENWKSQKAENYIEIILKGKLIGNDSAICPSVIKYLKDVSYDIIVIGGYSTITGIIATLYLNFKKIPFILSSDGGIIKDDVKIKYLTKKYLISKASAWLSTGKKTNDYLLFYGAKEEKIYTYPFTSIENNDVLIKSVSKEEKKILRHKLGIEEEKVIISVGRFIDSKGFDVLIKASTKISKEYGVYIIGGEPPKKYKDMKFKLNLKNVHFISFKLKDELKKYYMASDLFVLPTRGDIWGLVINEAMACGLPVITTNACIAGIELIKDNDNGFIIPTNDTKLLSEKIEQILSNENLMNMMSSKNLEKIKEYTIENMAIRHHDIFMKEYLYNDL